MFISFDCDQYWEKEGCINGSDLNGAPISLIGIDYLLDSVLGSAVCVCVCVYII